MSKALDLLGQRFGWLDVIERIENDKKGQAIWLCICRCGKSVKAPAYRLKAGSYKSCGCAKAGRIAEIRTIHGRTRDRKIKRGDAYNSWKAIKDRCLNPKNIAFHNYGGRGIEVCDRWKASFVDFLKDMGERPYGTTLDRINPNGNYEPGNCRWATDAEQALNKRSHSKFLHLQS